MASLFDTLFGLNGQGRWFNFMTGFGQFLPGLGILAGVGAWLRKHNCQQHGCWAIGRHPYDGGVYTCRKHHPTGGFDAAS